MLKALIAHAKPATTSTSDDSIAIFFCSASVLCRLDNNFVRPALVCVFILANGWLGVFFCVVPGCAV